MKEKLIIAGFGGQGVISLGYFIAYSAMYSDLNVTHIPSYGTEMRGGTANCIVIISDKHISNPSPFYFTTGLIFNQPSLNKFLPRIENGGSLFVNSDLVNIENINVKNNLEVYTIPANTIAERLKNPRGLNIVMFSAWLHFKNIIKNDSEIIKKSITMTFKEKKEEVIRLNMETFKACLNLFSTQPEKYKL